MESLSGGGLRIYAPAKINLNLLVGEPGDEGYHQIDSLVSKVSLYDEIELSPLEEGRVDFTVSGFDCGGDADNLALRAANLLSRDKDVPGARIALVKHIGAGRGLGGGSSDAAAVLLGLNELWGLRMDTDELIGLSTELGCDVPLFLGSPAVRVTGRGERLEEISVHDFTAILIVPTFACSTGEVYRAFDERPAPMGEQLDATLLQSPPSRWRDRLVNQLLGAARAVAPELGDLLEVLSRSVTSPICLTGSGSAVFVLCDDASDAAGVLLQIPDALKEHCTVVRNNPW